MLTGTVRWWKDDKGYGRINGDDGYIYFCHFSAIVQSDESGFRNLQEGERVQFEWQGATVANERRAAVNVRVIAT
jgi:CspA family cold shock protein